VGSGQPAAFSARRSLAKAGKVSEAKGHLWRQGQESMNASRPDRWNNGKSINFANKLWQDVNS
jgi:hypothetical protein